jgi:hypothetical protein
MNFKDLTGKVFGSLTVLEKGPQDKRKRYNWLCRCLCGKEKYVASRHLIAGATKTCGCRTGRDLPKPYLGITGERHPKWKGGSYKAFGYNLVYQGPYTYEFEHRIAAGLSKKDKQVVHHKNHDKLDNRPENLEIMTRSEHAMEHGLGKETRGVRQRGTSTV